MFRACEGWFNPVRFKCFACAAEANAINEIQHRITYAHRLGPFATEADAREEMVRLRNEGFNPDFRDDGIIYVNSVACTGRHHDIQENPYIDADGNWLPDRNDDIARILVSLVCFSIFLLGVSGL